MGYYKQSKRQQMLRVAGPLPRHPVMAIHHCSVSLLPTFDADNLGLGGGSSSSPPRDDRTSRNCSSHRVTVRWQASPWKLSLAALITTSGVGNFFCERLVRVFSL